MKLHDKQMISHETTQVADAQFAQCSSSLYFRLKSHRNTLWSVHYHDMGIIPIIWSPLWRHDFFPVDIWKPDMVTAQQYGNWTKTQHLWSHNWTNATSLVYGATIRLPPCPCMPPCLDMTEDDKWFVPHPYDSFFPTPWFVPHCCIGLRRTLESIYPNQLLKFCFSSSGKVQGWLYWLSIVPKRDPLRSDQIHAVATIRVL